MRGRTGGEKGYWGNILRLQPWDWASSPHSTPGHSQVSSINRVLRALQEDQRLPWAQLRSPGGSWNQTSAFYSSQSPFLFCHGLPA